MILLLLLIKEISIVLTIIFNKKSFQSWILKKLKKKKKMNTNLVVVESIYQCDEPTSLCLVEQSHFGDVL